MIFSRRCPTRRARNRYLCPKISNWICLLCNEEFAQRNGLTKHNERAHFQKGVFGKEFPCPRCRQNGQICMIENATHWRNHVHQFRGLKYTPCPPALNCLAQPSKEKVQKQDRPAVYYARGCFVPGEAFLITQTKNTQVFLREHLTVLSARARK